MKFLSTNYMISGFIILVLLLGFPLFFKSDDVGEDYVWLNKIEMTGESFSPESVAVLLGEEIEFINTSDKDIWPASNFHPTHKIFSEFDPLESIGPRESWTFLFDKEGTWHFHDHLDPFVVGKISVFKSREDARKSKKAGNCKGLHFPELDYCVSASIEDVIAKDGIRGGLDFFLDVYKDMAECHQIAHRIGEVSYESYLNGDELYFGPETALCGWGFWHGFSTRFAQSTGGDYGSTKEFCNNIDKYEVSGVDSCFHGVGIGLVPDPPKPSVWGDEIAIANIAAESCAFAKRDKRDYMDCLGGAYHGVFDYMRGGLYKLTLDEDLPFTICRSQEGDDKKDACYSQAVFLASTVLGEEIDVFFNKLINTDPNWGTLETSGIQRYAVLMSTVLPQYLKDRKRYTPEVVVSRCRQFPEEFQLSCIEGLVKGQFMTGNIKDKEYLSAEEVCLDSGLNKEETDSCYESLGKYVYEHYKKPDANKACLVLKEKSNINCSNE